MLNVGKKRMSELFDVREWMKVETVVKKLLTKTWWKAGVAAKLALVAALGFSAVGANAAVSSLTMSVISDGTAPFDATSGAGLDNSANNGIARSLDKITYRVSYSASSATNAKFVLTLPVGAAWDLTSAAASVCNGPGGGVLSGNTLTCNRIPVVGVETFAVTLVANTLANGSVITPTVSVDGATPVSGPSVTVSAAPKAVFQVLNNNAVAAPTIFNGVAGQMLRTEFAIGIPKTADIRGAESIAAGSTFELSMQPGSVMDPTSCTGTVSCSQPGGPGTPVTVTIIPQLDFHQTKDSVVHYPALIPQTNVALFKELRIFVPNDPNFPPGQKSIAHNQYSKFDPNSISGQSNFGSGFSNNMDPSFSCSTTTIIATSYACNGQQIDRSTPNPNILYPVTSALVELPNTADLIYGDDSFLNNFLNPTSETVVPSQSFWSISGFSMKDSGVSTISNAGICVVFNNELMTLNGTPYVNFANTYTQINSATTPVTGADLVVEYSAKSFASDNERRAANCGMAGDGSSDWSSNPGSFAGGQSSVTAVRFKYANGNKLIPGNGMVFGVPFARTTTAASLALADQTVVPWFWHTSYTDDSTNTNQFANSTYAGAAGAMQRGGRFTTQSIKVRHKISVSGPVTPGTTVPVTITPQLIGAATAGIDLTAKNVSITTSFPDNCTIPVTASLPAGVTFAPGNYGADGIPCTADDGAAGVLTVSLGDVVAPGGSPTSPYGGHLTELTPLVFNVLAVSNASASTKTVTSVISASNDLTAAVVNFGSLSEDRTEILNLVVNGASSFTASKSTVGVTGGKVGPNETFGYTINFGNGGSRDSGQGYFVDVLPFDGDDNGTTGLGSGKFKVTSLSAAMSSPTMGGVAIQYSTDNALNIQNSVKVPGQENGSVGINWIIYTPGGSLPDGVTAIRFVTENPMLIGNSGTGTIFLQAPTINSSSSLVNSVWARTDLFNGDPLSAQVIRSGSAVTVQGLDPGTIRGRVYLDVDMNNSYNAGDLGLTSTVVKIECVSGACLTGVQGTVFSMVVDANGGYSFAPGATVFGNATGTGTPIANFQGVLSGTWNITEQPLASLSTKIFTTHLGTVNGTTSGTASGRSITGVVLPVNGIAINYDFGEIADPIVDTTKTALPAAGTTVDPGQVIEYTLKTKVTGNPTQTSINLKDTLDPGLTVNAVPNGCTQAGQEITCSLPTGTVQGEY
ncbi:isopeptide-forming domain-containing fimbrial protein, partial [Formosimonas limnophila]|uniref:isopeptide-forming domain-containing fimbrial protein n=1 Tax=Formosimonas limnophila TaxID=1384487 RepID=UPI001679B8AE